MSDKPCCPSWVSVYGLGVLYLYGPVLLYGRTGGEPCMWAYAWSHLVLAFRAFSILELRTNVAFLGTVPGESVRLSL